MLKTCVEDGKRVRLMGPEASEAVGAAPLGELLAGVVADRFGAATTITIAGILCVMVTATIARQLPVLRAHIRPIYAKLGLNVD